jgi:hypothetical protein
MLVAYGRLLIFFSQSRERSALLIEIIDIHAPCDNIAVARAMSVVVRGVRLSSQLLHVRGLLTNGIPLNLVQQTFSF